MILCKIFGKICSNITIVEVQTWTPLENSTMWQHFWPPHSVLSPFVQTILHNIDRTGTFAIEFLCRSKKCWHKCAKRTRSYINGSNVHWRIGGRWNCGVVVCGGINNIDKIRGEGCCFQSSQQSNTLKNKFLIFKTWQLPCIPHNALLLYSSLVLPNRSSTNVVSCSTIYLQGTINLTPHAIKNKSHHFVTCSFQVLMFNLHKQQLIANF